MARPKKKPVVKFLYPSLPVLELEEGESYTLFHRNVANSTLAHDDNNEECWCSPIVMRDKDVPADYTYEEYRRIVDTSLH